MARFYGKPKTVAERQAIYRIRVESRQERIKQEANAYVHLMNELKKTGKLPNHMLGIEATAYILDLVNGNETSLSNEAQAHIHSQICCPPDTKL